MLCDLHAAVEVDLGLFAQPQTKVACVPDSTRDLHPEVADQSLEVDPSTQRPQPSLDLFCGDRMVAGRFDLL